MTKKQLISKIKSSLQATLNIGEDTFNDCPIHKQTTPNIVDVIETVYYDGVKVNHYIFGLSVETFKIPFEKISKVNLELILENVEQANSFLENN